MDYYSNISNDYSIPISKPNFLNLPPPAHQLPAPYYYANSGYANFSYSNLNTYSTLNSYPNLNSHTNSHQNPNLEQMFTVYMKSPCEESILNFENLGNCDLYSYLNSNSNTISSYDGESTVSKTITTATTTNGKQGHVINGGQGHPHQTHPPDSFYQQQESMTVVDQSMSGQNFHNCSAPSSSSSSSKSGGPSSSCSASPSHLPPDIPLDISPAPIQQHFTATTNQNRSIKLEPRPLSVPAREMTSSSCLHNPASSSSAANGGGPYRKSSAPSNGYHHLITTSSAPDHFYDRYAPLTIDDQLANSDVSSCSPASSIGSLVAAVVSGQSPSLTPPATAAPPTPSSTNRTARKRALRPIAPNPNQSGAGPAMGASASAPCSTSLSFDKNSIAYLWKRERNNEAVKRSRAKSKLMQEHFKVKYRQLEGENRELRRKLDDAERRAELAEKQRDYLQTMIKSVMVVKNNAANANNKPQSSS